MSDVQDTIIDAAEQLFSDYGYGKTTMAEIAEQCDMSVGNLYRHFANKEAIAVASMQRLLEEKLAVGNKAAQGKTDAREALAAFLLARLRLGHAHFAGTRHLFDMMQLLNTRHRDLLVGFEGRIIDAMASIIERGVAQGSFHVCDARQTAYDIHQATLRYNSPIYLKNNPLDVLEADLGRLLALLYKGLAC
jgi:AcrR family transcriptional regulator